MMKINYVIILLSGFLIQQPLTAADISDGAGAALVTAFWQADSMAARDQARDQLLEAAPDIATLYQWVKSGPVYSRDVALGQQESVRLSPDGTRFPYVFVVPASYDPAKRYAVEFMLHGGVSRPEWEGGGGWWRRGYDAFKEQDRITVVPASWTTAFWWEDNQAENLPAILSKLKQTYNIDDNRAYLAGVSDGGTGAYFFAFKQPSDWAVFLPYIGHPGVLRNSRSGPGHQLYFDNVMNKPLYIVNGEDDPLYPVSSVLPFIQRLEEAEVGHVFTAIENGGHNTRWMADETPKIEQFKLDNPRDPLPEILSWVADRTDRYNRNAWIRIDELDAEGQPGMLQVARERNEINITSDKVNAFTLLLNPEEINVNEPVTVNVNGITLFEERVTQDASTLLKWTEQSFDKEMLFTAELNLRIAQ
jgi:predicted esterase